MTDTRKHRLYMRRWRARNVLDGYTANGGERKFTPHPTLWGLPRRVYNRLYQRLRRELTQG